MKALYQIALLLLISFAGCKKEISQPPATQITLPDATVFVGGTAKDSAVIYALDGSSGALVARYGYKHASSSWCLPFAARNILYAAENNTFKALNIKTGALMWADSLKSYSSYRPILHDDTFYGAYASSAGSAGFSGFTIYALDATKQSNTFLWQYPLAGLSVDLTIDYIKYYNSLIYVKGSSSLIALDAKTGTLKFTVNGSCSLPSDNGTMIAGNSLLDAATGIQTFTVPSSLSVSNTNQYSSLEYATENMFFMKFSKLVSIYNTSYASTINVYDRSTDLLKWGINGGYRAFGYDTVKNFDQIYNNQVIIKTAISIDSKDGRYTRISYSGHDINNGQVKWSYEAGYGGQSFTVKNMQYSAGAEMRNTYYATPISIVAADLNTGKIQWSNNKLYINQLTYDAICLYAAGKCYASYIQ